uniref:Uncharacterized protein n=1 Tax=Anopheles atroparvus TaxID=41427 RepID=A0A182JK37_ANOAO
MRHLQLNRVVVEFSHPSERQISLDFLAHDAKCALWEGERPGVAVADHESSEQQKGQQNRPSNQVGMQWSGLFHVQADHEEDGIRQTVTLVSACAMVHPSPLSLGDEHGRGTSTKRNADHQPEAQWERQKGSLPLR